MHPTHYIFRQLVKSWKNKRNKKSGARGIRTPDLWHDDTKGACVATRASCLVVNNTHTIQNKINSPLRIQILRATTIFVFNLKLHDFEFLNSLVSQPFATI